MFIPNIFYLPFMPAQIYGRHSLPKFKFTFMKNVNIHNSLLWLKDITIQDSWLKSPGLKSLGLKGPGLKLGVEKAGVEMSFNHIFHFIILQLYSKVSN